MMTQEEWEKLLHLHLIILLLFELDMVDFQKKVDLKRKCIFCSPKFVGRETKGI